MIAEIDAVDAEGVCTLAGELFAPERLSAAAIGPSEEHFLAALERALRRSPRPHEGPAQRILAGRPDGKVGAILGPALVEAGHELVATEAEAEAMVDFTAPDAVVANILRGGRGRCSVVVGTSGWDTAEVDAAAKEAGVPVFFAPNFALGAVLMMRFAAEASQHFTAAEIVELHHADEARRAVRHRESRPRRAMGGDVPIHSVRLPGLVAHQEVVLGGRGETLTIRHDTSSREAFVPGVCSRSRRVRTLPPGVTVGLDALL